MNYLNEANESCKQSQYSRNFFFSFSLSVHFKSYKKLKLSSQQLKILTPLELHPKENRSGMWLNPKRVFIMLKISPEGRAERINDQVRTWR